MSSIVDEPNARENYFYLKGAWRDDFRAMVAETIQANRQSAANAWSRAGECWRRKGWYYLLAAFFTGWTFFIWVGAVVLIPTLLLILSLITAVFVTYSNLVAGELRLVERIYLGMNKMQILCPSCHREPLHEVPRYECPVCHMAQLSLMPSARYGAFYRVCSGCGTHLPTSRFFGRHKLPAFCSHDDCQVPFDSNIETVKLSTVAFVGTEGAGKTSVLLHTILRLLQEVFPNRGMQVSYPTEEDKNRAAALCAEAALGTSPKPTTGDVQALCLDVKKSSGKVPHRLYFYDPPGKVFSHTDDISGQLYYHHLKVAIFVIDPMSIPSVAVRLQAQQAGEQAAPQRHGMEPDESINRWMMAMERDFPRKIKNISCAVLINRADRPGFAEQFQLQPDDSSENCERFLEEQGLGNMLESIKSSFKRVCVFSIGETSPQQKRPVGLEALNEWVLENLDLKH